MKTLNAELIKDFVWRMETAVDELQNGITEEAPGSRGVLRNRSNWTREVKKNNKRIIGTVRSNVSYAVYVHQGTGRFAENRKGRPGWWVYVPGSNVRGKNGNKILTKGQAIFKAKIMREKYHLPARISEGIKPNPFVRRALKKREKNIRRILAGA